MNHSIKRTFTLIFVAIVAALLLTMYINDSDLSRFVPDLNKGGAALMDMELDASALPGLTAALDHGELRLKCSYASAAEVSFDCEFVLHQKE